MKLVFGRMERGLLESILGMILPGKKEAITIIEGLPLVRFCARPFHLGVIDSSQLIFHLKNAGSEELPCPESRAQATEPRSEFDTTPFQHTSH